MVTARVRAVAALVVLVVLASTEAGVAVKCQPG